MYSGKSGKSAVFRLQLTIENIGGKAPGHRLHLNLAFYTRNEGRLDFKKLPSVHNEAPGEWNAQAISLEMK